MKIYWHDKKRNIHIQTDNLDDFEKEILLAYHLKDEDDLFKDKREVSIMAGLKKKLTMYLRGQSLSSAYYRFIEQVENRMEEK